MLARYSRRAAPDSVLDHHALKVSPGVGIIALSRTSRSAARRVQTIGAVKPPIDSATTMTSLRSPTASTTASAYSDQPARAVFGRQPDRERIVTAGLKLRYESVPLPGVASTAWDSTRTSPCALPTNGPRASCAMVMGVVDAGRIVKANGPIHVRIWPETCTAAARRPFKGFQAPLRHRHRPRGRC